MKVCLINPPLVVPKSAGLPFAFQPLGLLYIAAVLEEEYDVQVLDAIIEGWENIVEIEGSYIIGLSWEHIRRRLEEIKPDVVGISAQFSINEQCVIRTASEVKTVNKGIITIVGGAHATVQPMEMLSNEDVDYVVIGEGELTVQELLSKLGSGSPADIEGVLGVGYKKDGLPTINGPRPLIEDLDQLPLPARHLIPMEKYFDAMRARRGAREMYTFDERWISIITSRGCTYNCNFCSINLSMGSKFRKRSPENVVKEIRQIINSYGIQHVNFEDDNLTLDKQRAERIFDLMIENNFGVSWSTPNGVRVENIDDGMVAKMKDSGCRRVFVAPESGVQRVLTEIIGKNLDLEKIDNAVVLFKKYGIIVDGSFIMGFIGETKKEMWRTVRYILHLKKLGMSEAGLHIATPYFGTRLYEEAVCKGLLRKEFRSGLLFTGEPLIETPEWNAKQLVRIRWIARLLLTPTLAGKTLHVLLSVPLIWKPLKFIKRMMIVAWRCTKLAYEILMSLYQVLISSVNVMVKNVRHIRPKPELMVFEVTDACNSRCAHCYIWKEKPSESLITPMELKKALSDEFFSDLKVVLLTGGEPVLRNDIDELILAIHDAVPGAQISLSTNGLLPDKVITTVTLALENNIRLNVGVSLDAVGERHDIIRGVKGNFNRVNQLMRELITLKKKYSNSMGSIVLGHTLSNLSVDTVKEVRNYAQGLGVDFVTQLHEKFSYYHNDHEQNGSADDYREADNTLMIREIEQLPKNFHNAMLLAALKHRLNYTCSALDTFFLLKCDGSVSPCLHFCNTKLGNIRDSHVFDIWQNPSALVAREMIKKCRGCSNTWAAEWSKSSWPFSFWKELLVMKMAQMFRRNENNTDA